MDDKRVHDLASKIQNLKLRRNPDNNRPFDECLGLPSSVVAVSPISEAVFLSNTRKGDGPEWHTVLNLLRLSDGRLQKGLECRPEIDFDAREVKFNKTGEFLAVIGAKAVSIVHFPLLGRERKLFKADEQDDDGSEILRTVSLGKFYHSTHPLVSIIQVEWHPLSSSHICVLSSDGHLRMYDISQDAERPISDLILSADRVIQNDDDYSVDAEGQGDEVFVSFCFNEPTSDQANWDSLAVIFLTSVGALYTICPYCPHGCSGASGLLDRLEKGLQVQSNKDIQDITSEQIEARSRWITTTRDPSVYEQNGMALRPLLRGPFDVEPYVEPLPSRATQLIRLRGSPTVFVVLYESGQFLVYVMAEQIEAAWQIGYSPHSLDPPSVTVIDGENLKLPTPNNDILVPAAPRAILDPIHDDVLYIYHWAGCHRAQITPLTHLRDLDVFQQEGVPMPPCRVNEVLMTMSTPASKPSPLLGVESVADPLMNYFLIVVEDNGDIKFIGIDDPKTSRFFEENAQTPQAEDNFARFDFSSWLNKEGGSITANMMHADVDGTPESVEKFVKTISSMKEKYIVPILQTHDVVEGVVRSLQGLQRDQDAQLSRVEDSAEDLKSESAAIHEKIVSLADKQTELSSRAEQLVERWVKRKPQPVSPAEQAYFSKLQELSKKVEKYQEMFASVQNKMDYIKNMPSEHSVSIPQHVADQIFEMLEDQSDRIKNTVDQVKSLRTGLEGYD